MAIPFFGKKDKPPAKPASRTAAPKSTSAPAYDPTATRFEVAESPVVEEAAVLYANNQPGEAVKVLRHALKSSPGDQKNPHVWLMLLELYQLQGMRAEFDALGLEFAVRFERSPPAPKQDVHAPKEEAAGTGAFVLLSGVLNAQVKPRLEEALKTARQKKSLRIDVSRVKGVEEDGAAALLNLLQSLRKAKIALTIAGLPQLSALLQSLVAAQSRERNVWLLLLELYQVQGLNDDFENTAVDYAVNFELSPPSWETVTQLAVQAQPEEPRENAGPGHFVFEGVMSGAHDSQLNDLATFMQERNTVTINMARLAKMDFGCAGALLNLLTDFRKKGKAVRIAEANELVLALLKVLGADAVAVIAKDKHR
ncbi:MAG TPA: STAS domain-containing protein [Burkholderiales bacterium]|nr:STAS domain-containing protein [Burkholderiales bacterium]